MTELSVVGFQPDWGEQEWDKRRWGDIGGSGKGIEGGKREVEGDRSGHEEEPTTHREAMRAC